MQMLDRYLAAIARELPKAEARDIVAELKDTLLSQIEEREAGLARKLTRQELEAMLTAFGHPLAVAGRYRRTQHLIGPDVFPFWWWTTKLVFAVAAAIWLALVVIGALSAQSDGARVMDHVLRPFWPGFLMLFGGVTLTFAVMERLGMAKALHRFNPRQLPPVRRRGRGRFELAFAMAMGVVFLLWWLGVIHFRNWLPGPVDIRVDLAPIWIQMRWPIAALAGADILISGLELVRPGWTRTGAGLSLAKNLAGLWIVWTVLQAGHWLDVTSATAPHHALLQMQYGFDLGMRLGLTISLVVHAFKAAWDVWRLVRALFEGGVGAGTRAGANGAAA